MPTLVPLAGSDWTDNEIRHIERLRGLCRLTPNWAVDCGRTDEGDPWCVVCDDDAVILHIARIDRAYVVASGSKGILWRSRTIENAVDEAVAELTAAARNISGSATFAGINRDGSGE